jgi:hypothetical protein
MEIQIVRIRYEQKFIFVKKIRLSSEVTVATQLFSTRGLVAKLLMVGFKVLTAVSTKMAVFWVVAPDDGGSKDL